MKALGYFKSHQLNEFAIKEIEVPEPSLMDNDLLVQIKSISVNPVDCKIRKNRSASNDTPIILGWDASGIVAKIGKNTLGFKEGDEVFYAGNLTRDGSNAEFQAVDYRLVAKKPKNLNFTQAASIPLTSLTGFEALLERNYFPYTSDTKILIIAGAGGVGCITTQILKAKTSAQIIVTASRPETTSWCKKMGADLIINHKNNLKDELNKNNINQVDLVFGTSSTSQYLSTIASITRPFGHLCVIDDLIISDNSAFKQKSISINMEFMFTKSMFNYYPETQGKILKEICFLVEDGKIISTENIIFDGLSSDNLRKAHEILESGKSMGKIIINVN